MAEQKMVVLICDEPIPARYNEECGRPAAGTVHMRIGTVEFDKDLCESHLGKYEMNARRKVKKRAKKS